MKSKIIAMVVLGLLTGAFFVSRGDAVFSSMNTTSSISSVETVAVTKENIPAWPPKIGQKYPDLELIDQEGVKFKLSDLQGQVIIIEPVGMNCPACQAFSGGNEVGAFQGNAVQSNLFNFRKMVKSYSGGARLPSRNIVVVQLLLYDMKLGAPLPVHAELWAEHFGLEKSKNEIVAVSTYDMRNSATYNMIPGFQLVDKNFVLRSDSTGHQPKDDLYRKLLPMISSLEKQVR